MFTLPPSIVSGLQQPHSPKPLSGDLVIEGSVVHYQLQMLVKHGIDRLTKRIPYYFIEMPGT